MTELFQLLLSHDITLKYEQTCCMTCINVFSFPLISVGCYPSQISNRGNHVLYLISESFQFVSLYL